MDSLIILEEYQILVHPWEEFSNQEGPFRKPTVNHNTYPETLVWHKLPPQKNGLESQPGSALPDMSLGSPDTGSAYWKPNSPDPQWPQA